MWDNSFMSHNYSFICTFFRYLELVHPIWHKTHFKIKWIYISFVINWQFGPILIAAHHVPTTKVGKIYLLYFFKFTLDLYFFLKFLILSEENLQKTGK